MVSVDTLACRGCGACVEACPTGAIALREQVARVDAAHCTECGACVNVCPERAIVLAAQAEPSRAVVPAAPTGPVRATAPVEGEVLRAGTRQMAVRHTSALSRRIWPLLGSARQGLEQYLSGQLRGVQSCAESHHHRGCGH